MKILRQTVVILAVLFAGRLLNQYLVGTIPGSVLGMVVLLALLETGLVTPDFFKESEAFLLDNLAFFFIPPGVALITLLADIRACWWQMLLLVILGTGVVMAVTGLVIERLIKRRSA